MGKIINTNGETVGGMVLFDAAGDVPVGTGANTATKKNLLAISAHGNSSTEHTLDMSANTQHSITLNATGVTLSITDPGDGIDPMCRVRITDNSAAVALTWQKTGGGGTFVWANDDELATTAGASDVYTVWLWRVATDTYDCGYVEMGF